MTTSRLVEIGPLGILIGLFIVAGGMTLPVATAGATVIASYSGVISSVRSADGSPFAVGDTFAGTYVFDEAAPDIAPSPTGGAYAITHFDISTSGGYTFSSSSGTHEVGDSTPGFGGDNYAVLPDTSGSPFAGTRRIDHFVIGLYDDSAEILSSDALPTTRIFEELFDATDFRAWGFGIKFFPTPDFEDSVVSGGLSSLSFTFVPEPSVGVMIGLGLVILGSGPSRVRQVERSATDCA